MRFENGKMHDVLFVGMPRQQQDAELTRNSIALATRDTFIYVATLLDVSKQFALVDPSPSASFLGAGLQKIGRGLAAAGITADDWQRELMRSTSWGRWRIGRRIRTGPRALSLFR
jgi:hypothetical protein